MSKARIFNWLLVLLGLVVCALVFVELSGPKADVEPLPPGTLADPDKDEAPTLGERVRDVVRTAESAVQFKANAFHPSPKVDVPIRGKLRVEVIDPKTLCLVGYYHDFLRERFLVECGDFLRGIDSKIANLPAWSRRLFYYTLGAEIILKYRPVVARAYQNTTAFALEGGPNIAAGGYWVNPVGQACFPDASTGEDIFTMNAEVAHFAFLRLAEAMEPGKTYTLRDPLGESVTFTYAPDKTPTPLIKYNQLGYAPQAERKYAYAGAWLGTLGPLPLGQLNGKPFHLRRANSGEIVYSRSINPRGKELFYKGETPFTGEEVYQLDFSDFLDTGSYYIEIPGVGRSPDFPIEPNVLGEPFYIHARGLYHKRCGIAKEEPYTPWVCGECHMQTYQGNFPPNIVHYKPDKGRPDAGFFNAQGEPVEIAPFKMVALTATETVVPGVHGGWHDAADYDRRPFHYDVVTDLLSAYLLKPQNFSDGQLNIPESGNGVPDIIDETTWNMELWRKAQKPDGSVGGWIEATSHPEGRNPATDVQRYYLSAATMESTMQYAAHAAMLALALTQAGHPDRAQPYIASAKAAYDWASDPSHRAVFHYNYPFTRTVDGKKVTVTEPITYREEAQVPAHFIFKTAFNLFLLTGEPAYLDRCRALEPLMSQRFAQTSWCIDPLFFTEFAAYHKKAPALAKTYATYKERTLKYADERLEWLNNNYPYRIPWYPPEHHYVGHMSWGKFHPFNNAKFFMLANALTGEPKYRTAAYLCNDFHNGANPFGTTMTSGLGHRYPVKFLDLPSYTDGIPEYVPGITPYRNTFGIARSDVLMAHGLFYRARPERGFAPEPVMLLPKAIVGSPPYDVDTFAKQLGKAWPIWRRYANVEAFTVPVSEYTISETIAPAAALTGWLMEPGWMPSEALKHRKPAGDIRELEGFAPLP